MTEEPEVTVKALLGAVPKSKILKPDRSSPLSGLHRRMVNVVCKSCGERLAMVTDEPDEPWLTVWAPTISVRANNEGEPLWSVEASSLPVQEQTVGVYCLTHGAGDVRAADLLDLVAKYRRTGRAARLVVETQGT